MGQTKHHTYSLTTTWTGNLGSGTETYRSYSRNFEIHTPVKASPIPGSSDPLYRGDKTRYNPEEMLLGAVSSCHMLWVLHLCADAGIVVTEYADSPLGEMVEHADGSGEFTSVVLKPVMSITDGSRTGEARALHDRAHHLCCLARSMGFPVRHEVEVRVAG